MKTVKEIKELLTYPAFIWLVTIGVLLAVNAWTKETTTLDEALEHPVKVEKFVDKVNGVVCYWSTRHPQYLDCVKVTNTSKRHAQ